MENENKVEEKQEALVPQQEEQKPDETPVKEPKQNLLGKIKAKTETAKENRKQWCEKHPKIVKGIKIMGTGITVAAGVVGGLFLANEMAKRSDADSSEGVEEETIPWEGEDLDETETTEESMDYPTEE